MRLSLSSNFILSLILINTTIITVRMFAYINDICQKNLNAPGIVSGACLLYSIHHPVALRYISLRLL